LGAVSHRAPRPAVGPDGGSPAAGPRYRWVALSNTTLWMIMGYLLIQAVLVVSLGRPGDMYGRLRVYNMGFVVFTAASMALSFDSFRAAGPARTGRSALARPRGAVVNVRWRWLIVDAFFKLIAAGPLFFVSAWLLMLFAGIVGADVGIRPFGYLTAMVVTIALWLALAPAIGAVGRAPGKSKLLSALPRRAGSQVTS
jgi:hypothetical protein